MPAPELNPTQARRSAHGIAPGDLPERIEALLFDLDDTLIDARGAWRAGFAEAVAPFHAERDALRGLGSPESIYDLHFRRYSEEAHAEGGNGEWSDDFTRRACERLLAEHGGVDAAGAARLFEAYMAAWPKRLALFADAEATLAAAAARYRLALVSNGPSKQQRDKVERFGLERWFETVVISEEVGVRKPDRAIFALALETLGAGAAAAVHVGDHPEHDVRGALEAGLGAVWVNRGDWTSDREPAEAPLSRLCLEVADLRSAWGPLGLE